MTILPQSCISGLDFATRCFFIVVFHWLCVWHKIYENVHDKVGQFSFKLQYRYDDNNSSAPSDRSLLSHNGKGSYCCWVSYFSPASLYVCYLYFILFFTYSLCPAACVHRWGMDRYSISHDGPWLISACMASICSQHLWISEHGAERRTKGEWSRGEAGGKN